MTTPPDDEDAALRDRAEAAVAKMAKPIGVDSADATHELLVHQVELEMQNEELRRLQAALEADRTRYFELFDLAPVGYVTLDGKNLISEANLTSAQQFGLPREKLVKRPFSRVILPADQDIFYLARKALPADGTPQTCQLRLLKSDGATFWGLLKISAVTPANGETGPCRLSITDITEKVKIREDLARRE